MEANNTINDVPCKSGVDLEGAIGRVDHRLDSKRRVIIPLRWHDQMGSPKNVYVMENLMGETCLDVYTEEDFNKRIRSFMDGPMSDTDRAEFVRDLAESCEVIPVDAQQRIRIPDDMLAYAGLETEIVLLRTGRHLEVWSLANRPKKRAGNEERRERMANRLRKYGV